MQQEAMHSLDISHQFKNAVYMNNAAVRLMLHGQHRASHNALRDAIHFMANVQPTILRGVCVDIAPSQSSLSMPSRVQRTARQIANLCSDTGKVHQQQPIKVRRMRLDGSMDPSWIVNHVESKESIRGGIAVYIEDTSEDNVQGDSYEMTCAIVLSNLALNHSYLTTASTPSLHKAIQMLEFGQKILGVQSKQCISEVSEGSMYVAVVIWNNVCCVQQHAACKTGDLIQSTETLSLVTSICIELCQLYSSYCPMVASAA